MSVLEFISNIVSSTAWPIIVLVVIVVYKKDLDRLLLSLKHLKYKAVELDFSRVADSAKSITPAPPTPSRIPYSSQLMYSSMEEQILDIAERIPSASILLAWATIETAMSSAVANLAISPESPSLRSPFHNLNQLKEHADLPIEIADMINEMRLLRNKITHDDKHAIKISKDSALSYCKTAITITEYLKNMLEYPSPNPEENNRGTG